MCSTLLRSARPANPSPAGLAAIAWHALLKTADKEAVRDDLAPGSSHCVNLTVAGDVDGQSFERSISAVLSVGHDSTRATSATPAADRVIASILAKLNERTREAILRDLPEDFAANDCSLPDVAPELAVKAAAMLSRLRAKKPIDVRGSVSCRYSLVDDHFADAAGGGGDGASELTAGFAVVG
jgi:hypothetical protein